MPKPKTIKLNKADTKEIDELQRRKTIAEYGVKTANKLHFEAGEWLWKALGDLYPEIINTEATYHKGVITYTPREKP